MAAILLTTDLMTVSKAQGAAARAECALTTAATADALLALADSKAPRLAILDLSAPGIAVADLVARLKAQVPAPTIIAFGPHVHEGRLEAATQAGCDLVLARGQFHAQAEQVLRQYG